MQKTNSTRDQVLLNTQGNIPSRICPKCLIREPLELRAKIWPKDWACASCGNRLDVDDDIVLAAPELANSISGFDPSDFDYLSVAELNHFWFVVRRNLIVSLVDKYSPASQSYLELGCGTGNVISAISESRQWDRVVGTEIHPRGLKLARPRLPMNVELMQLDARHLPFSEIFEVVGAFDVLEHIAEDEDVLAQVQGAMVSGGIFVMTVPQHPWLWSVSDEIAHHERRYSCGELEEKLRRAGFIVEFSTSYTTFLLPLMAASRILSRFVGGKRDVREVARQEFEISTLTNGVLTKLLEAEVALTKRGMRWPAGGSRVIVARRP
jgi:SAM-dependent methyltransferase